MSKSKTKTIEAVNRFTGYIEKFDFKVLSDFEHNKYYIGYVLDMYMRNPWAFINYRNEIERRASRVNSTNDDLVMLYMCEGYAEHYRKIVHLDYLKRKHLTINSEVNKILRDN